MKIKTPIVTLLAGTVIAGVLFVLNVDLKNDITRDTAAAGQAATTQPATETSVSPTAPPPTTAPPPPSQPAQQGTVTYAGSVAGGKASIAIVVSGGNVLAYLCDGKAVEAWLSGTAVDGKLDLTGPKGNLAGSYGEGKASGKVSAAGKTWEFAIRAAAPPSGLYRSAAEVRERFDASWLVRPDGIQVGLRRNLDGTFGAVPNFNLGTRTVNADGKEWPVVPSTPENPGGGAAGGY